jgi:8-oxo-dGTP pyrophosphatase MutT (NUDIX family)
MSRKRPATRDQEPGTADQGSVDGLTIAAIGARLATYRRFEVEPGNFARAGVAIVLRDAPGGPAFIVIHRAHRSGDPWSGHMALPGGRQHPEDPDLPTTAARETREEVGVDLADGGRLIGTLDDLRAIGGGRPLDLVITPFVFAFTGPADLTPNPAEVQSAFWVPIASLRRPDARGTYRHQYAGYDLEHPAFLYDGYTIWGLTHRILTRLLEILS